MIYELQQIPDCVKRLFAGWEETLIYSCLQGVMGKVFVTDPDDSKAACAFVGCFAFYAGVPDRELVQSKPKGFVIMVPADEEWAKTIEACFSDAKKVTRYAIRKDTVFDRALLQGYVNRLPEGYKISSIDGALYDQCLLDPDTADFVSSFGSKEAYLQKGRGVVILKEGAIVAGASSYTRYNEGIEIEVDTKPEERRKHLALAACAKLILNCLEEGLYPSWDAQNRNSVLLSEKLGYVFSHEYTAYEVSSEMRTH